MHYPKLLGRIRLSRKSLNVLGPNAIITYPMTLRFRKQGLATQNEPAIPKFAKLLVSTEDSNNGLRRIVMNEMKTRNALSLELMTELETAINFNKSNPALRAISIESVKGTVFSAGHNLKELTSDRGIEAQKSIFAKCTELVLSIRKSDVPVIGVVDGLAAAAGCQLVASCDFTIASTISTFSTPGANFGLFCSTPGVSVSRAVNQNVAAYMVLTGIPISAEEALQFGLITKVVPSDELESKLLDIYGHIQSKSRSVLKLGKQFFYEQLNCSYAEALKKGESTMVTNLQIPDCQEGLQSFKDKRKPKWVHS